MPTYEPLHIATPHIAYLISQVRASRLRVLFSSIFNLNHFKFPIFQIVLLRDERIVNFRKKPDETIPKTGKLNTNFQRTLSKIFYICGAALKMLFLYIITYFFNFVKLRTFNRASAHTLYSLLELLFQMKQ